MSRKKKNLRAKALERKNRKCGVHSERHASSPASPSLRIETLEPRILLSATWVDSDTGDPLEGATAGNDTYTGTEGNDVADGLGGDDTLFGQDGNDTLHGNSGQDSLFGEAGDDELYGGPDNDTLDGGEGTDAVNYSDATASVTVDLTTGTATGGGGDDTLTSIEGVIGSDYDDTFAFSNPSDGATYTVDGGGGTNTIDLSAFTDNQINDDGSTITVEPGGGQSFTVNYSNVENITTAEGTYNPGGIPAGNNAPDAVDDAVSTTEDTAVTTGNVLANDTDPEGDTLSVTGFTQGANGTVVDNGDGTFTYTPNADFSGTDSFTYTVDDGNGGTDTATVTVTVDAVNDAPTADAGPDQTVDEQTQVTLDATGSSDPDGDALMYTWTQTGGPAVTLSDANAAQPTFDAPDVSEQTTLTFQVEVNDGQVTHTDIVTISVNQAGGEGGDLTNGLIGHWALDGDTSDSSDSGNDGTLAGADGDEWVGGEVGSGAASFDGVDDIIQTEDNDSLQLSDDYTISIWINPDSTQNDWAGILSKTNVDGSDNHWTLQFDNSADRNLIIYHPGGGNRWDTGLDLNDIADEWHHITVTRSGTTMSCHLDGELAGSGTFATDPGSGTGHLNIGGDRTGSSSYLYTGEIDDVRVYDHVLGADAIGQLADMGGVTENTAPTAADDAVSTSEDTPVTTGNVLANDSDPDGDALSITGFTQGANGTVVDNGDGTFTYTPNADFSGTDSFTYTVDDGNGGTDTATVNVTVNAANDAPTAADDAVSTSEDTPVTTGNVLANDSDPDGDALSITDFTQGANGTVVDNGDGTFTYTPNADFSGTDSFTYTVDDGNGGTDTATVNVTVDAANDAPTAADDAVSTSEDTPVTTGNVLANDSDPDGDALSITGFTQGANGTVVDNGDGTFTYTPNADFSGTDSFTYTVDDGNGGTDTATVNVTVDPADGGGNNAPTDLLITSVQENQPLQTDGAATGVTVVGIYAPGSDVNLLEGKPPLTTLSDHQYFDHSSLGYTGYNYMGSHHWFSDNGVSISGLNGGQVVFSDGTTGVIDAVSNGAGSTENAYVYYRAYDDNVDATINENSPPGTVVATFSATDPDSNESFTYSIADNSDFEVVGNELRVKEGAQMNHEAGASTTVDVTVTDSAGDSYVEAITVHIADVNEAPLNISLVPDLDNPANLTSGAPSGTTVVGIYAPDSGINLLDGQPELTTLSDHAYFDHGSLGHTGYNYMGGHHWFSDNGISISGLQGGKVVFSDGTTGVIDAVSNGAGTTENAYIYYEAYDPTAGINVADGAASGTTVATLGANDPDVGDSVTYAIAGDSDQFEIVGNSILVKDGATLDSEVATSHDITVCVTDAAGLSHNQSFTIYVGDGNHAPTAADDAVSTTEDTAVTTGNVLANDTDPEGDTLSVTGFTQGTNGTVVDNDDGTFTYTPNADFSGNDSFTYTVDDGNGGTDTATVNVTVTPVSQPAPEPEPVEPVGFPHADDFSDGVADGFQAVDGTWAVSDGAYEISGLGNTGDNGVAVLNFDGPLPEAFEIGAQLESDNVSGQYQNGFIIFDYNGPDDFKFAGARVGADYWTVGHYDGSWVNDATLSQPINTGTPYDMHLNVDGGQVTLSVDGVEKVSHDFGESLNDGQVGLAADHAQSTFDNLVVDVQVEQGAPVPPEPVEPVAFPHSDDFSDGVADGFQAVDGTWAVSDGAYEISGLGNSGDNGVAVLNFDGPLPEAFEIGAQLESDNVSGQYQNGFIIFDYNGPDDFKFAGARVGADYWTVGHYDGSWVNDATLSQPINTGTLYDMHLNVDGGQVTLSVDGVEKVSYDFGEPLNNGQVGLAVDHAQSTFDNLVVDVQVEQGAPVPPEPVEPVAFPHSDDFSDGVADGFQAVDGTWAVSDGAYEISGLGNSGDNGVAVLNFDGPLPEAFEIGAQLESDNVSGQYQNGFIIFDYNGPDDFKFAGARVGADYWTVGHYDGSWVNDATLSQPINTGTPYDMHLNVDGGQVTLSVDGVEKVSYDFGEPLNNGQVGLAADHAQSTFDNLVVNEPDQLPAEPDDDPGAEAGADDESENAPQDGVTTGGNADTFPVNSNPPVPPVPPVQPVQSPQVPTVDTGMATDKPDAAGTKAGVSTGGVAAPVSEGGDQLDSTGNTVDQGEGRHEGEEALQGTDTTAVSPGAGSDTGHAGTVGATEMTESDRSDAGARSGSVNELLDDPEDLDVLDPMEDLGGAVEFSGMQQKAAEELEQVSSVLADGGVTVAGFEEDQVIELSRAGSPEAPAPVAVPPDMSDLTAADVFEEVVLPVPGPNDVAQGAAAALALGAMAADPTTGLDVRDSESRNAAGAGLGGADEPSARLGRVVEDTSVDLETFDPDGVGKASNVGTPEAVAVSGAALSGFFARLWGAVRGLGGVTHRSSDDTSEDHRRGQRS